MPEKCLKNAIIGKIIATFNETEFDSVRALLKDGKVIASVMIINYFIRPLIYYSEQ